MQQKPIHGINYVLPESLTDMDVSVVQVGPNIHDGLTSQINNFFDLQIESIASINSYILFHEPDLKGLEKLLTGPPFVDPVIHQATLNESLMDKLGIPFDYAIQWNLRPGTSDDWGMVALENALKRLRTPLGDRERGFLSKEFFLKVDGITLAELQKVADYLANPELNESRIITFDEYKKGTRVDVPLVLLKPETIVEKYAVSSMNIEDLQELNETMKLAASDEELRQFADMYKDEDFLNRRREFGLDERATDVEIRTWFGLRSEHCFHKEFNARITLEDKVNDPVFERAFQKAWLKKDDNGNSLLEDGLFKTFIEKPAQKINDKLEKRGKNWIKSMFKDNSGVVLYDENYMFCIKFETHNSPSNKEPIQGAKTGINGNNRDIFGTITGTFEAISNFFYYCTGDPKYKGWLPKGVKHPKVILKGITEGVKQGGNESQIPTLGGGVVNDPRYIAKCLVYCGTVGWSPVKSDDGEIEYTLKKPGLGDIVLVAGQPVGIDGIGGATESSMAASKKISLGHVQADFSLIQKQVAEYLLEVSRDGLLTSVTDFGAMGLGSAAIETARETNGLLIDLALHPKKYKGIQPWQIITSETQNRMLLVAKEKNLSELLRRADLHSVQLTPLGKLTNSGFAHLKHNDETVGLLDLEKLFNKEPKKQMHAVWNGGEPEPERRLQVSEHYTLQECFNLVMAQPDVASKEWFFRQKDSSVKGGTLMGPLVGKEQFVNADATLQKPLETEGKDFGALAYAMGIAPKVSDIDPYYGAQKSFVDMVGKIVSIGGALPDMNNAKWDAWAVCGNYCQPNSDAETTLLKENGEHNLASLLREGIGVAEAVDTLDIPVISGKDSMKCSCEYEVDFAVILGIINPELAEQYRALDENLQENIPEALKALGQKHDESTVNNMILQAIPPDLREHVHIGERKKTLTGEDGKEYEIMRKSIEIHDPDTYLASAAVKIQDYRKCVDMSFKEEGDKIYVLGTTHNHLGGSQMLQALGYAEQGKPIKGGEVPKADLEEFKQVADAVHEAIDNEIIASCSYLHDGGLGVALMKAAMAGGKGAEIDLDSIVQSGFTAHKFFFSETPGRFMVTVSRHDAERFEELIGDIPYMAIGKVSDNGLNIISSDSSPDNAVLVSISEVQQHYRSYSQQMES